MLPESFIQRIKHFPSADTKQLLQALEEKPITSVRLNPAKPTALFETVEPVPWCNEGRYLKERPVFTLDPLFHAGAYYVQEASSMFVEQAWKQINPHQQSWKVLDLCAAPGGKSTHLLSLMQGNGLLVSNEIHAGRNAILRENITKWGYTNGVVTQNQASDFERLGYFFDCMLIDAPCSGEGLFRKDANAIAEWSEENVAMCAIRQRAILSDIEKCLKPGGYLIYSTCTFEAAENDEQIQTLIDTLGYKPINIPVCTGCEGIVKTSHGYAFYPGKVKGEGFFLSVLQKPGNFAADESATAKNIQPGGKLVAQYTQHPEHLIEWEINGNIIALPTAIYQDFTVLKKSLYVKQAGTLLGEQKGKDFIPAHDIAVSLMRNHNIPCIELDKPTAIAYLRGETPAINPAERGFYLVTHHNLPLGWIKHLGNRYNNHYPKGWRILMRG